MKQERCKNPGTTGLQCWPMSAHIQYRLLHEGCHLGLGKQQRAGVREKLPPSLAMLQTRDLNARNSRDCITTHRCILSIISGKGEPVTLSHSSLIPPSDIIWKELP